MNKVMLFLLLLVLIPIARADTCEGGTNIGHLNFGGQCKSNAIEPSELDNFYQQMRDAADQINALPDEIKKAGPGGSTLIDATAGAAQISGYVKWLFSYNTAQELLGSDFAPIGVNILIVFTMTVAMIAIYIAINLVVFTIRMVVWIVNQVLKLIPFW